MREKLGGLERSEYFVQDLWDPSMARLTKICKLNWELHLFHFAHLIVPVKLRIKDNKKKHDKQGMVKAE